MTHLARFRLSIVLAACLAVVATATAFAHAIVTRTDPIDGGVLAEAPRQIRLWFSEEIALNLSKFAVIDTAGGAVPITSVQADAVESALIIIDLPELKPSAYRVSWDVLSTDDLHLRHGSIVFGVQTAAEGAAAATPEYVPQPFEVMARWIDFVALASLIGALALTLLALPASIDPTLTASTGRRLLTLAVFAAGAALITSSGGVVGQAVTLSSGNAAGLSVIDAAAQLLTQTEYGSRWLMREGWTLALLVILVWQRRQISVNRLMLGATLPLIGALAVLQAMNGHATSFTDTSLVRIAADALHLLGAGVWVGGLIALTVAIVPLLRRAESARRGFTESALARSILRRFGLLASASLGVLFVTGLYNSGQQVASLDALLFTLYGQALLLKIGLVLIVGLIGLLNSARLHPRVAAILQRLIRRPIGSLNHVGRTVTVEAIGAIGILLIVAVLGSSQPARGPEFDPPTEDTTLQTVSTNVEGLFMTFSIKPNRPGQNFISIGAFNTRRPAPAPIEKVTVRFAPPDGAAGFDLHADLIGKEKYQITGDAINSPGDWQMTVQAQRPGLPTATWTFAWNVMPASALSARPVKVSNQPIEPWLNLAAGLGGLIGVGTGFALWRRMKPIKPQAPESAREVQSLRTG